MTDLDLEKYRYLATQGFTPEEAAREVIQQGLRIIDAIWVVTKIFGLHLGEAKDIGARVWLEVHGTPAQDGLENE
jgi:hypothetical protein